MDEPIYEVYPCNSRTRRCDLFLHLEDALDFCNSGMLEPESVTLEEAKRLLSTTKPVTIGLFTIERRYFWTGAYVPYE